jgi:DNA-binding XRE family transcriptional regulator
MAEPKRLVRPALQAFAKELNAARVHAGISQVQLAKRAGMTRQGLRKIELGGNVTLWTIILLANALDCQVSDFFRRKAPWD